PDGVRSRRFKEALWPSIPGGYDSVEIGRDDCVVRGLDNGSEAPQSKLAFLASCDVFHGQQDERFVTRCALNAPCIQKHHSLTALGKRVLDFKITDRNIIVSEFFEHFPQFGNIPLFRAQPIKELPVGLGRRDLEVLKEGGIAGDDPQFRIENHERLTNRVDNSLGELLGSLELLAGSLHQVDVSQQKHSALDLVVEGAIGTNAQEVPTAVFVLHLEFLSRERIDDLPDEVFKIGYADIRSDVTDRPANVGGENLHGPGRGRGHQADAEAAVDHNDRQ